MTKPITPKRMGPAELDDIKVRWLETIVTGGKDPDAVQAAKELLGEKEAQ